MIRPMVVLTVGLVLGSGAASSRPELSQSDREAVIRRIRDCDVAGRICDVSIGRLVASPEAFHGKTVRVTGVASVHFEGNRLSPSRGYADLKGTLWVDFDRDKHNELDGKVAVVEGTFDGLTFGHWDCCGGAILNVTRTQVVH